MRKLMWHDDNRPVMMVMVMVPVMMNNRAIGSKGTDSNGSESSGDDKGQ
jgi:hypothetical protein